MSTRQASRFHRGARWGHRLSALALVALVLMAGCVTESPPVTYRHQSMELQESPKARARAKEAQAVEDEGEFVFITLSTDFAPVQVGEAEFREAMARLMRGMPRPVALPHFPLSPGRKLALASVQLTGGAWQSKLAQDYDRFCERRGTPGDCLSLFTDGPHLQADDKRTLALALAVGPALEGLNAEVRAMLDPARVAAMMCISVATYMTLLVAPEPVSKGVAAAFSILLWSYLGWEMWGLIEGWMELSEAAARATTFAELREAGEHFGKRIGPNSVRILVMVGTAAVGETAALVASRAPRLASYAQASRMGALHGGVRVVAAVAEAERIIVSVPEGSIRVVLAPNAVAMAARGAGDAVSPSGKAPPTGYRAWRSYSGFKKAMGSAGKDKEWHHIVEQTPGNVERFGPEALHNTENVVAINAGAHKEISAYYSSIQNFTGGQTVRKWLSTQSYETQRAFGLKTLRDLGVIP